MSTIIEFTTTLQRSWDILPCPRDRAVWTFDTPHQAVRGPFDLALVKSEQLRIVVGEGQTALKTCRGTLQRVYFEGTHLISSKTAEECPDDSLLYILQIGHPLVVPWCQHLPLLPGKNCSSPPGLTSGTFVASIIDPCVFHASFLANRVGEGESICRETLAHLLPSFLAIHLARSGLDLHEHQNLVSAIDQFPVEQIDPDLAPYGLCCQKISLSEKPGTAPLPVG